MAEKADFDKKNGLENIPEQEPQRQYCYIKLAAEYVKRLEEALGRKPLCAVTTFGCQMNARDSEKLAGILLQIGYQMTDSEEEADFVIYNTCTVRDNANQRVYGRLGVLNSLKKRNRILRSPCAAV